VRAKSDFVDHYGVNRRAGEEWLITDEMTEKHIVDVYEESVKTVYNTILSR
jgi:major vault protein